ncbi:MAG: DsbA family protein [Candidatus Levyibacteriota bacterium]
MSSETKVLIGISVVTLVLVVGAALIFGGKSSTSASSANDQPVKDTQALIRKDSHIVKGTAKNAVTIVEFGDFQCPACGAAYPTVEQLRQTYKGQLTFVFRNFPLTQAHPNAMQAAEAAEAAGAQGKFFDMYNLLYTNQAKWADTTNALDYFMEYAKQLKLDTDKFKSDVTGNKYANKIQQDMQDGNTLNVEATPTFFINGVKQEGGLPYADFKAKIDDALKKSSK